MVKCKTVKMIDESDWSQFVSEHYDRPYRFQQQDGGMPPNTYLYKNYSDPRVK